METKQSTPRQAESQEPPQTNRSRTHQETNPNAVEGEAARSAGAGVWQEGESSGSHGDSGLIPGRAKRTGSRGEAGPQVEGQVSETGSVVSEGSPQEIENEIDQPVASGQMKRQRERKQIQSPENQSNSSQFEESQHEVEDKSNLPIASGRKKRQRKPRQRRTPKEKTACGLSEASREGTGDESDLPAAGKRIKGQRKQRLSRSPEELSSSSQSEESQHNLEDKSDLLVPRRHSRRQRKRRQHGSPEVQASSSQSSREGTGDESDQPAAGRLIEGQRKQGRSRSPKEQVKGESSADAKKPLGEDVSRACKEAFRRHSGDLITIIQNPEVLAWQLFGHYVISNAVREEVCMPTLTPIQRKVRLLAAVRDQIAVDPAVFGKFLLVLRGHAYLMDIARRMKQTFEGE